jgi:hypothetical protein
MGWYARLPSGNKGFMLGEIFGRIAGLGCVELFRFFPFGPARGVPLLEAPGLGGTSALFGGALLLPSPAADASVGIVPPSLLAGTLRRLGRLGRMAGVERAGGAEELVWPLLAPLEEFANRIKVAGVAGLFLPCEVLSCGPMCGDRPLLDRGVAGGGMRISDSGSGEMELDSLVLAPGNGKLDEPGRELSREPGSAISSMMSTTSFAVIVALVGAFFRCCAFIAGDFRIAPGLDLAFADFLLLELRASVA